MIEQKNDSYALEKFSPLFVLVSPKTRLSCEMTPSWQLERVCTVLFA